MGVLLLILNSMILRNFHKLRSKIEKAAMYCRTHDKELEVMIILDSLQTCGEVSNFRMERLCKWASCFYRIPIRLRILRSAVPVLTAVEEISGHKYEKVFYTLDGSYLKRAIPKSMRLDLEDMIGQVVTDFEVA